MRKLTTHKDRYMKAVHRLVPDMVPVDGGLDLVHAQRILGKTPMSSMIFHTPRADDTDMKDVASHNQRLLNEAAIKLDFDALMIYDWNLYPDDFRPRFTTDDTYVDHIGRIHRAKPDVKTTYWVDGIVKSPADLEKFELPDPGELNFDLVNETLATSNDEYAVLCWSHSAFIGPCQICGGIDKFIFDLYRQPDFARGLIEKVFKYQLGIIKRLIESGVDIIVEGDDIADLKGPMISPKLLREFYYPYLQKFVEECHSNNVPVMKHSDGNLYPILEDLVSLGIDGLHPMEPSVMDLGRVKQQYGDRIFLRGNVDCVQVLPYGSEEDVRREVKRCIDAAAEGGGFILSESNSFHSNVKTENIQAMVDEARKYGKYA
jgi:uroporphyrinogen-III decarboxylase